jgi:hypothetical protein
LPRAKSTRIAAIIRGGGQTGRRQPNSPERSCFQRIYPLFASLLADSEGNVWVEGYRQPGEAGPTTWTVLDSAGRWITDVTTPEGLRLTWIDSDRILGVWCDELGVEYVRVYSLDKP